MTLERNSIFYTQFFKNCLLYFDVQSHRKKKKWWWLLFSFKTNFFLERRSLCVVSDMWQQSLKSLTTRLLEYNDILNDECLYVANTFHSTFWHSSTRFLGLVTGLSNVYQMYQVHIRYIKCITSIRLTFFVISTK